MAQNKDLHASVLAAVAMNGFGGHDMPLDIGYNAIPKGSIERAVPVASTRRRKFSRKVRLSPSKYKPHQGARERARRREKYQTESAIEQATRWESWKKGRRVEVVDGYPFCYPAA